MSAESVIGPRMGTGRTDGAYQFPALGTTAAVMDLTAWAGEYITITWLPAASGVALHYGFNTEADSGTVFDTTTATASSAGTKVARSPDFIDGYGQVHRIVPLGRTFLRIIASAAGGGRCTVRHSDGQ